MPSSAAWRGRQGPGYGLQQLPEAMSFEHAATLMGTYGTVHYALSRRARLRAGESLLVLGAAGGIGLAAVELGRASVRA